MSLIRTLGLSVPTIILLGMTGAACSHTPGPQTTTVAGEAPPPAQSCAEIETLVARRGLVGEIPQDWRAWWSRVDDYLLQTHLNTAIRLPDPSHAGAWALVVSCQPAGSVEGSRQWVVRLTQQEDRFTIEDTVQIGSFDCCSGSWLTSPEATATDINRDGQPELRLHGTYQHGNDAHQLRGEAELILFFGAEGMEPAGCPETPPGLAITPGLLRVVRDATYSCFAPLGDDRIGTFNRITGRLIVGEESSLVIEEDWSAATNEEEITEWMISGDQSVLHSFADHRRRRSVVWNPETRQLEERCGHSP